MDKDAVTFQDYLEAKYAVDEESLHKRTFHRFTDLLSAVDSPRVLDIGTGTGAMIHRLLSLPLKGDPAIIGLDIDSTNLQRAKMLIGTELRQMGGEVSEDGLGIESIHRGQKLAVELLRGDFLSEALRKTLGATGFHCITAHAILDLLPLDDAVAFVSELLVPGGLFYTTINYDGVTSLLPSFSDREFEKELLATYNRSMDERESGGKSVGGSRTGFEVFDVITRHGLAVEGFGASDWSLFPWEGRYADGEARFLRSIIETMHAEGLKHPHLDGSGLEQWRSERLDLVKRSGLALIVHQTDSLARKLYA